MVAAPFIGEGGDFVQRSLSGFARACPEFIEVSMDPLFVKSRLTSSNRTVGLVSGGGSGHEPMHVGLVGRGMLDAVAPGHVFASPHNRQIFRASTAVARDNGVLHIVKNYTGDRINFGIAAERLANDGIRVGRVLVDDDIATDDPDSRTGRRGTAATIIVEKILGAAADEGFGLDDLVDLGTRVVAHARSLAVASAAQTVMSTGLPAFAVPDGELEYGVGIHGERGRASIARPDFPSLVRDMTSEVVGACPRGKSVIVIVNGLGATTQLELYNVFDEAARALESLGRDPVGALVGTFSPALDMHGFSITVCVVAEPDWLRWWRAPVWTPAIRTRGAAT